MKNSPNNDDLTGRDRLAYNVIIGWLAQLIFVASGFILPRMINTDLGKETLGIWDLSWSMITYFEFIYGSLSSSVNRYVAKHRAGGDINGVNIAVSSAFFTLLMLAALVGLLLIGAVFLLPRFMQAQLGSQTADAQKVLFFLGLSLISKICFAVFGGILTGCHRWDLQHGINAASRLATLLGMIVVLALGGSLPHVAMVYFSLDALVIGSRCSLVFKVCPGLKIHPRLARRSTTFNMWRFGLKTLLPDIGNLLSEQTFNILLVWFLGPAALAGYARPRALVRFIQTFARRYSFTLTPTASSLQVMSADREIHNLFVSSCQFGSYIVFPMVAVLTIMGGPVLQVWMGKEFADNLLPAILALGYMPVLLQLPLNMILQGLNSHGRPGLFKFLAAVVGIVSAFTALSVFHFSVNIAAAALFLPFWVSEFIATPLYAAKRHGFPLTRYWLSGIIKPLLVMIPMLASFLFVRIAYAAHPLEILLIGLPSGFFCFTVSYWYFGASKELRKKIVASIQSSRYIKYFTLNKAQK